MYITINIVSVAVENTGLYDPSILTVVFISPPPTGEPYTFVGLTNYPLLNGVTLTPVSAAGNSAIFSYTVDAPDYGPAADTGSAITVGPDNPIPTALLNQTVISQYGNSPTLLALVGSMNLAINPSTNIDRFFDFVFNVETAIGVFLDAWGRIVGISRNLTVDSAPYSLTDTEYRTLILAKALSNISGANAAALNQLLQACFPGIRIFVSDLGSMEMGYVVEGVLSDLQYAILTQSGVVLRPAGVGGWYIYTPVPMFGFAEAGYLGEYASQPFNQGVFYSGAVPI